MIIGYEKARNLMAQLDWKMRVEMDIGRTILRIELYHPNRPDVYTVRIDSGKRLMTECRVCSRKDFQMEILCYDHDGSDETLI